MPGGVIGLTDGDGDNFRTLRKLPRPVMELMFCHEDWAAVCGGKES